MYRIKFFAASGFAVCVVILVLLATLPSVRAANNSCQLTWQKVTVTDPGGEFAELRSVDTISTTDVWAVGSVYTGTLIEHWNGSNWQVVSSPAPLNGTGTLAGVSAVSTNDVWAVGSVHLDPTGQTGLIMHWDGNTWNMVSLSSVSRTTFGLHGVHAIANDDIWAVGNYKENNAYHGLTLHWNGTAWSEVSSPDLPGTFPQLFGVSASASNDVWAIGTGILHWDGTQWNLVSNINGQNIVALAQNDVWTLSFAHWDSAQWTYYQPENIPPRDLMFEGIDAVAFDDVYAVGYETAAHGGPAASQHWNGTEWRAMQMPDVDPSYPGQLLYDVNMLSADEGWAVGKEYLWSNFASVPLIFHATSPCIDPTRVPDTPTPLPIALKPPKLISPQNGATIYTTNKLLDWQDSHAAQFYRVQVVNKATGAKKIYKPTASQQRITTLNKGATYQWRVKACVTENNKPRCSIWSRVFSFTVRTP